MEILYLQFRNRELFYLKTIYFFRFHSTFQDILHKYQQFDAMSLEIENRMMQYNTSIENTARFFDEQQRFFNF